MAETFVPEAVVLDDYSDWRKTIAAQLRDFGLIVHEAGDLIGALDLVEKHKQGLRLVTSDVNLGEPFDRSGEEFVLRSKLIAPAVVYIGITGGKNRYADYHVDKSDFSELDQVLERVRDLIFTPRTISGEKLG